MSFLYAFYAVPASSSPWNDTSTTTNKVHYAGNETNGVNYSWYTATASTQGSNYSICPRGWKLPTKSQYETLLSSASIGNNSAGSSKIRSTPYNFPYAGYVYGGSLQAVGSQGNYWSSTGGNNNRAYILYFDSSNVNTNNNYRYVGFSVRCITP